MEPTENICNLTHQQGMQSKTPAKETQRYVPGPYGADVNCDDDNDEEEEEPSMGLRRGVGTRHILYSWPASK
ncbi:unnamed protein product [Sphagnum tenellum]